MDKSSAKKGNLAITLSTFLYILFDHGIDINDDAILSVCNQIATEAGRSSVEQVVALLQDALPSDVEISQENLTSFVQSQAGHNQFQSVDPFELGKALVEVVSESIPSDSSVEAVMAWLEERVPSITNGWDVDEDQSILQKIRQYEFKRGLPWIGRLAERTENGLEESWIMVEKVTDTVLCMDPYPWDDVDEEFTVDVPEFLLRWSLAGSVAIHLA
jgi:hypothetical protein